MFCVGSPLCVANESKEQEPYRLSKLITPEFQSITLVLDPDEVVFRGDTDIQIVVSNTVEHIDVGVALASKQRAARDADNLLLTGERQLWQLLT